MTPSDITPGITVLVPIGADLRRPSRPYRLRVTVAWPGTGGMVRVGGHLQRLDGTPSGRMHGYREADVFPADLTIAEG